MFFQNTGVLLEGIKQFILNNKKALLFLSFLLLALFPEFSFAAAEANNTEKPDEIMAILNAIITGGAVFIGVATQFAGMFLSPEWSSGSAIGFGTHLKTLWIMVSNIVYLIFAFLLIWIALMNILGKGGDWELKQALPKFIGGVLIVPFTWLIVAGMIGLSNILTISVLSIPFDTFGDKLPKGLGLDNAIICKTFEINSKEKGAQPIQCKDGEKVSIKTMIEENDSYFGILTVYTYNIMKFDENGKLYLGDLKNGINSWADLVSKSIFDLIFYIAFLILIVAITLVLFVRGVRLWFFTILSPIFGLLFFFGSDKVGDLKKFSLGEFMALVLVPVYVSAALAFGLLFIHVAGEGMNDACENEENIAVCTKEENGVSIMEFLGTTFEYHGTLGDTGNTGAPKLETFKGVFGELILKIFGLVFLWIAVIAALERSSLTQTIVAPIKSFGESVGKLAAAAPTYLPILPNPAGGMMNMQSLQAFGGQAVSNIESKMRQPGNELATNLFGGSIASEIRELTKQMKASTTPQQKADKLNEIIAKGFKDGNDITALKEALKEAGMKEDKLSQVTQALVKNKKEFKVFLNKMDNWSDSDSGSVYTTAGFNDVDNITVGGKVDSSSSTDDDSTVPGNTTNQNVAITVNNNNAILYKNLDGTIDHAKTAESIQSANQNINSTDLPKLTKPDEITDDDDWDKIIEKIKEKWVNA